MLGFGCLHSGGDLRTGVMEMILHRHLMKMLRWGQWR